MPVLDLAAGLRRRAFMSDVAKSLMTENVDYGVIPGTGSKPTLLKPGAERLCTLFGLSPELDELAAVEDWTGEEHGGEPFFYYRYKVRLTKNGILLAEAIGACSNWESRYRYRAAERTCPRCGKPAIIRGKEEYGGGWICFGKKGGCGAKYKAGDDAIESQQAGRVINPDAADIVNTVQKMAQKRALVAAVLLATNGSEFYTQDAEDLAVIDVPSAQTAVRQPPPPPDPPPPPSRGVRRPAGVSPSEQAKPRPGAETPGRPWRSFRGMLDAFAELRGRLGPDYEHVYYSTLAEFNVAHSNEFKDGDRAAACYSLLLERVLQVEAAAGEAEAMPPEDFDSQEASL
jgi:hypothetical protein